MKKKFIIIGIFILIIALIIIISVLTMYNNNNTNSISDETDVQNEVQENEEEYDEEEDEGISIGDVEEESNWIDYSNTPSNVTNQTYFYIVQSCIKEYMYNIFELDEEDSEKTTEEIRTTIYNTLNIKYIKENDITTDNIEEYVRLDDCESFIGIRTMMQLNIEDNNVMRYVARCMVTNTEEKIIYLNFIVYLDYSNLTFAIEPIENNITDLTTVNLNSNITEVDKNNDNGYTLKATTIEEMLNNYIKILSKLCLKYPEVAYEYLNKEYKEETFATIESFQEYIEENKTKFENMEISSYSVERIEEDEYSQYLVITKNGFQILIEQTAIMQFNFEIL